MKNKNLLIVGLSLSIIGSSFAVASEEQFQNNLLKMDVAKTSLGGVKVTLYTKKPYNDSIVVNKKGENEYVILMPETASSLTAKPALNSTSDVIQNVEVKTQQYSEKGQKGYTKIIVSTSKPIEITSSVQTAKKPQYTLTEAEYKELMAQATKKQKAVTPVKAEAKKAQAGTPVKNKVKAPEKVQTQQAKPTQTLVKKTETKTTITESKKETKIAEAKTKIQPKQTETKPVVITPPVVVENPTAQVAPVVSPPTPAVINPVTSPVMPEANSNEASKPAGNQEGKIQKIKNLVKNNLPLTAGLSLIALLLLIIIKNAGKTAQKMKQQKETFEAHLNEQPEVPINYTEKIDEDMDWKEKFQTYVDTANSEKEAPSEETIITENKELDSLFSDETIMTTNDNAAGEIYEDNESEYEGFDLDSFGQTEAQTGENLSIDDIFGNEEETESFLSEDDDELMQCQPLDVEDTEGFDDEIVEEVDECIQSQFKIDNNKSFYLVDFEGTTALVGQIEDEIFVLKRFDDPIKGTLQARLNEKKGSVSTYMVKADRFKALIEVAPEEMNLLIEL